MMRCSLVVVVAVVACLASASVAFAGNPADLTVSYRYSGVGFYQFELDNRSGFFYLEQPLDDRVMVEYMDWRNSDSRLVEGAVTFRATDRLELGLVRDDLSGAGAYDCAMADYSAGQFALGLLAPLNSEGPILLGPRYAVSKSLSVVATLGQDTKPLFGANYRIGNTSVALAGGRGIVDLRVAETRGQWMPELRLRRDEGGYTIGASISFIVK